MTVCAATFGAGGDMNSDALLSDAARQMDWSPEDSLDFVDSDRAQRLYDEINEEVHRRGVCWVPTMLVGDEMWWGNDLLGLLEDFLRVRQES